MAFVKLDVGILDSTLWALPLERDIFLTGLCMSKPFTLTQPMPQLDVTTGQPTGWEVPPGDYGFIASAGPGIVRRAMLRASLEKGMAALTVLGEPEAESRSSDFEGRRLVRVNGGYIALNYQKYRDHDYTAAERQQRRRERMRNPDDEPSRRDNRDVTRDNRDGHASRSRSREEEEKEALRAFPADADEEGWKSLAKRLGLRTIAGETWNSFKQRIRRAAHGRGMKAQS